MKISLKLMIGFMAILSIQTTVQMLATSDQKAVLLSMQPLSQEVILQSKNVMEILSEPFAKGMNGATAAIEFAHSYMQKATRHAQMYLSLKKAEFKKSSMQKLSLFDYVSGINYLSGFNLEFINLWDHDSVFYAPNPLFKDELACTKINGKEICKVQLSDSAAKELQALSKKDLYRGYREITEILSRLSLIVGMYSVIYDQDSGAQCTSLPIEAFKNRNFSYNDVMAILTATAEDFEKMAQEQAPAQSTSWWEDFKSYF